MFNRTSYSTTKYRLARSENLWHQNNKKKKCFAAPEQTKLVNIEDAKSPKLFHLNYGTKLGHSVVIYDVEQVHILVKPNTNGI